MLEKEISLMRGWQVFGGGEQTPDNDNQDGRIPTPSSLELAHWVLVCKYKIFLTYLETSRGEHLFGE